MEKKIDIAELLKDCPKGMELDCTMFEGVEFDSIVDNEHLPICCRIKHPEGGYRIYNFTKYGCWSEDIYSKSVIFPKGTTTWEGFHRPFKDGDIITDGFFDTICIFKGEGRIKGTVDFYCGISGSENELFIKDVKDQDEHFGEIYEYKFATEEEKQKLLQAIKGNGYKWNAENKTLEKLVEKSDITTLEPFDKVLMRSSNAREWVATFYSHYSNNKFYGCGMCCDQCIPYEGNQHLLGTTEDCDEYYKNKNWKLLLLKN